MTESNYYWRLITIAIMVLVANLVLAESAGAQVDPEVTQHVYVDDSAPLNGDGTGWSTAFRYLQDGIESARSLTVGTTDVVEVRIAQGVYKPDQDEAGLQTAGLRSSVFQLHNRVRIRGGFRGVYGGSGSGDSWDPCTFVATLSGDLNGDDGPAAFQDYGENAYHVVSGIGAGFSFLTTDARIEGCTIYGGNANSTASALGVGGGGLVTGNNNAPFIASCRFIANKAIRGGAAAAEVSGPVTFQSCAFLGNRADGTGSIDGGGAYHIVKSHAQFINCVFSGNRATSGNGGAVYISNVDGPAQIGFTNCTFSLNTAPSGQGGAIFNRGMFTATNGILWGNTRGTPAIANQITNDSGGTSTVTYSDVQGSWPGTGNINSNPLFVDADGPDNTAGTSDDNVQLTCSSSPCIDMGSNMALVTDFFDIDRDGEDEEYVPDARLRERVRGDQDPRATGVDQGAFEAQLQNVDCPGDVAPAPIGDGRVNVDDLLVIINSWGVCAACGNCDGDVTPGPCMTGTVNVDDLLFIINRWGPCSEMPQESLYPWYRACLYYAETSDGDYGEALIDCLDAASDPDFFPQWIEDCVDLCDNDLDCLLECLSNPPWLGWTP